MGTEENNSLASLLLFTPVFWKLSETPCCTFRWRAEWYMTYRSYLTRGGIGLLIHQTGKLHCFYPVKGGFWRKQPIKLPFSSLGRCFWRNRHEGVWEQPSLSSTPGFQFGKKTTGPGSGGVTQLRVNPFKIFLFITAQTWATCATRVMHYVQVVSWTFPQLNPTHSSW